MKNLYLVCLIFVVTSSLSSTGHGGHEDLTARQTAVDFTDLKAGSALSKLPVWGKTVYRERFNEIRDKKFLDYKGEKRRIPWMYVRDGCHVRATHFIEEAVRLGYEAPKRVFIFNALEMRGSIIPRGAVQPWFHAAPIVQVDGEPMVLDPSISFSRPLPLKTWASYVAKYPSLDGTLYSICEADTYIPNSSCLNPVPVDSKVLMNETQHYLRFELNILRNLGLQFK